MWRRIVAESFQPLEISASPVPVPEVAIRDLGQSLALPGSAHFPPLIASYPRHGTRLFSREDVRLSEALRSLATHSGDAVTERETGIENERQRIMRDLHDRVHEEGREGDRVNYHRGANVAAYRRLAKAIVAQGII